MKKLLVISLCIILAAAMTVPAMAIQNNTANKAATVIDGVKDDAYGDDHFTVEAVRDDTDPDGATAKVWTAWDDGHLYFYAEVYDTTPHFPGVDIAQNNSDSMTFFIDWNAGGVIFGDGPIDEGDTPWWEIRVYSGVNGEDGEWPVHGGWSLGDGSEGGGAMDVSIDWTEYPEIIEWIVVPLNGDYNNGYIVEIKIKAPDNVKLEQGKVIPVELHVTDNIHGEDIRDGRKYLAYHDNFANAYISPGNAGGRLTLGAEYAAPAPEAEEVAEEAPAEEIKTVVPSATKTGDGTMIFVILAAGIVIFFATRALNGSGAQRFRREP